MRFFEFANSEGPIVAKIVAATDQLKDELNDGKIKTPWTVDQLLSYYQKYDVILDRQDLYNMVQSEPMKDVISNIQGDRVIFRGMQSGAAPEAPNPQKSQDIVSKMAHKAAGK
jgi:hypothetical protein